MRCDGGRLVDIDQALEDELIWPEFCELAPDGHLRGVVVAMPFISLSAMRWDRLPITDAHANKTARVFEEGALRHRAVVGLAIWEGALEAAAALRHGRARSTMMAEHC